MTSRLIESLYLTEPGDPVVVRRGWRERWLSRPWCPWRSTRVVPMRGGGYRLADGSIVVHPETARLIRSALVERVHLR